MKQPLPYTANSKAIKGYSNSSLAKSERNDCVVRAIASCFDIEYDVAHQFVKDQFGRKPRKGTFNTPAKIVALHDGDTTINGKTIHLVGERKNNSMIGSLKYPVRIGSKSQMRDMTVGRFVELHPTGTFFLLVRGHAFTLKDGSIIGNPDDAKRLRRPLRCAFEIK